MNDWSPAYAELHVISNFTFLRGASHPEELVIRAAELGYKAVAITDECTVSGVVRAHQEASKAGIKLLVGSEIELTDGLRFVLLVTCRTGYTELCTLVTQARRQAEKGSYHLSREDVEVANLGNCLGLWLPTRDVLASEARWLESVFPGRLWITAELLLGAGEDIYIRNLEAAAQTLKLPICAAGNVHMHHRNRRRLQDVLTGIRLNKPVNKLGFSLHANGEHYLRSRNYLGQLYPADWLQETLRIAGLCQFSLEELRYEYPSELVPDGYQPDAWLRKLTEEGMRWRWPDGVPDKALRLVEHELALIRELRYEAYFLTVDDIVRFARNEGILCQGRGSAANSAVCYCLGITEVDPVRMELLFERFISRERDEPPDIDVDFEHERREEVIQYIYRKYGRHRAAIAATVVTYRPRSALRDVGKALGIGEDQIDQVARSVRWWDGNKVAADLLTEAGLDPKQSISRYWLILSNELLGFPRHLSQHVGGFVIAKNDLAELVPVENASMPERTVIQWEKDDLEALGLLKVDILALGMLSMIRRALGYLSRYSGRVWSMADIPAEDSVVYDMLGQADTVGVFQIESRAQMSMLPRLRPRNYYDLVIQIAIVRPGPIQGDMVHPYLARRSGKEPVSYATAEVREVLERTLGVPIFQEQVMQLAMVAAGFTPGEADQLRRSMAAWKRKGGLEPFERKLVNGMLARGYEESFARRIFEQIKGFGDYGFPESHSASFALLAYVSSWLKCYHHAAFTCALLNSQPMGFYAPAQLVQDARRHGVVVRPVNVLHSELASSLEPVAGAMQPALRLGLHMVKGLSREGGQRIVIARSPAGASGNGFSDVHELKQRAGLNAHDMSALAGADALHALAGHRYRASWEVAGILPGSPLLPDMRVAESEPLLRKPGAGERVIADYRSTGLTLGPHPVSLLREQLQQRGILSTAECQDTPNGRYVSAAGLVIGRQRPGTASGVVFVTLEDESGALNVIVWSSVADQYKLALLRSRLLLVKGQLQHQEGVLHLVAGYLDDCSELLNELPVKSRDFH